MWQVTTNTSHQETTHAGHKNGFVTGEWKVVTAPQRGPSKAVLSVWQKQNLSLSEIDELVEAVGNLGTSKPEAHLSLPAAMISHPIKKLVAADNTLDPGQVLHVKDRHPTKASVVGKVINELAMPRQAEAPVPSPLSPEAREQLLKLRATIMVEAEQRQLRTILICGASSEVSAQPMAADLSRLMSEYERLKIAYLEVAEAHISVPRNKVSSPDYTFRIKCTRTQNLYDITSSMGPVRLDDWLKNWTPAVVLGELKKMFDLVLINAPAITSNPEVALLAGAVDGVILVATENITSFASLGEAHRRLRTAQANVLGVTLNKAPSHPSPLSVVKSRMRGLMNFIAVIK